MLDALLVLIMLLLLATAGWLVWWAGTDARAEWRALRQRAADKRALVAGVISVNELRQERWRCVGCGMTWAERPRHADGTYADTWQIETCCRPCYLKQRS